MNCSVLNNKKILITIIYYAYAATKVSKLKRKLLMEDLPSPSSNKVLKTANGSAAKQAVSKQGALAKIKSKISKIKSPCPKSDGCARASINGWEWHRWSVNASAVERANVRGIKYVNTKLLSIDVNMTHMSNGKALSARTNRAKLRNLVAAAEGADLLKATQLKVIDESIFYIFLGVLFIWFSHMTDLNLYTHIYVYIFCVCVFAGKEKTIAFPEKQDT